MCVWQQIVERNQLKKNKDRHSIFYVYALYTYPYVVRKPIDLKRYQVNRICTASERAWHICATAAAATDKKKPRAD